MKGRTMTEPTKTQLEKMLRGHQEWILSHGKAGERALLDGMHLAHFDLRDANLHKASLVGVNLSGATLTSANLSQATLIDADLTGADLTCATMDQADLTRADLGSATLVRALMEGATLEGASLIAADLTCAILRDANLTGANLLWARLTGANLRYVTLRDANLRNVSLSGAALTGADLKGARLARHVDDDCDNDRVNDGWLRFLDASAIFEIGTLRGLSLLLDAASGRLIWAGKYYELDDPRPFPAVDPQEREALWAGMRAMVAAWQAYNAKVGV
jgi:uncharacterized protein YjbI with pentapeptide repeats